MTLYATQVRAREDARLLGHVNTPVPSFELPDQWTFALRNPMQTLTPLGTFTKVTLQVAEFREPGQGYWRAFSVPAKQWEEIKDLIR